MFRRNKSFGNHRALQEDDVSHGSSNAPSKRPPSASTPFRVRSPRDGGDADDGDGVDDDDDADADGGSDGTETAAELRETVANLKLSAMYHANSSAEAMEHLATLQKAHDALYEEHASLQEQMDDAVELLKYLKEEKGSYEARIAGLARELREEREGKEGDVVSMTISNLTKERMELEETLRGARGRGEEAIKKAAALDCENSELLVKIDGLEKVKEAYDLQTRQQLDAKTKLANLERERAELLDRVRTLEKEAQEGGEDSSRRRDEYEARHDRMARELEDARADAAKLEDERDELREERESTRERLEEEQEKNRNQEREMELLNSKLSNSLSHIAQLQRERREAAPSEAELEELKETRERNEELERANEDLLRASKDMTLYVEKMEETLMDKDELLETTREELDGLRGETDRRLASLREELEGEFASERKGLENQLSGLRERMEEEEDLHQRQTRAMRSQMEKNSARGFEEEREELSRRLSSLREELEEKEELHRRKLDSVQQRTEEERNQREEEHAQRMRSLQSRMEEEQLEKEEGHLEELEALRRRAEEERLEREDAHRLQLHSSRQRAEEERLEREEEHRRELRATRGRLERAEEAAAAAERRGERGDAREGPGPSADASSSSRPRPFSSDDSGHNELLLENESLKYRVQELQERLDEETCATVQRGEVHAQLEREMQERLAKRIAVQLHEQKITMEAQIREELEAEYNTNPQQDRDRPPSAAKSASAAAAVCEQLENRLRGQLLQVKEERERWKREQEEIQSKVRNSQQQFEQVREGFKKKIEKEKARSRELEKAKQDQQIVIDRLSDECQTVMTQVEELQEQIEWQKEQSSAEREESRKRWEDDKESSLAQLRQYHQTQLDQMSQREERYAAQLRDLQNEINDLLSEQTAHENEYEAWEDEKKALAKRYEGRADELRATHENEYEAWEDEKKALVKRYEGRVDELRATHENEYEAWEDERKALGKRYEDRMDELQATHGNEYEAWEDEKKALVNRYNGKVDELQRAMDDLEQLNSENAEYLRKIEDFENRVEELRSESEGLEDSRVKYSVLQIEKKELKKDCEKREEQNENLMRQMEQLNSENGNLQQQIISLERKIGDVSANLSSTQEERNKLQDSLQETSDLCVELESRLSSYKREKEHTLEEYESKIDELEELLDQAEDTSASVGQAIAAENDKAAMAMENLESRHQEIVAGMQKQLTDSTSQVSKLIDQLAAVSNEKTRVASDLCKAKEEVEALTQKITQLELSIESLSAERDAANGRMNEALSSYESTEQMLSSLKSRADENEKIIARLMVEKNDAIESLGAECDAANGRVNKALSSYESTEQALSSLKSSADESEKTIARLTAEKRDAIESLGAERDAANARIAELEHALSSLTSDADASKRTITRLTAEKRDEISKANELEDAVKQMQANAETVEFELRVSKSEINNLKTQIEAANQRLLKAEEANAQISSKNEDYDDYETKIQILQSEIVELEETNAQLKTENTTIQAHNAPPQNTDDSINKQLMKDLLEVNDNFQKLKMELRDTKDNNAALEEAVQDIQVEKEDLEVENEELASKLTDLTTQAKKMLLNNESLEEAITDQQVEYEDRIADLESQLADRCADDDLRQKHQAALETIVKLKKDIDTAGQDKNEACDRLENEKSELREVIDHLSSENEAAKEIKFIVLELRAKNMELTESLRVAQEQNKAAADIIETLKADNDKLRNDIDARPSDKSAQVHDNRLVPFERETKGSATRSDTEADLRYNSIVSQMRERQSFSQQLTKLMNTSEPPQRGAFEAEDSLALESSLHAKSNEGALVIRDDLNNAAVDQRATNSVDASSYAPSSIQLNDPMGDVEDQIRKLTVENGQLAQRLGGALAEKEFAMTTLTKLGAKMKELVERNKLLSEMADMKGQRLSRRGGYYSGDESVKDRCVLRLEPRGRDPDAIGEVESNTAYTEMEASNFPTSVRPHDDYSTPHRHHDSHSVYSGMASTIMSYEPPRKLEPESSSIIGKSGGGEFLERRSSIDRESNDQRISNHNEALAEEASSSSPEPKLVKVPGGEYFGQLDERGQKHGNGKMKYDNGNEYEGQWKHNKRDGKGITKYASGNVYTGTWKMGKRHGFGVFHIKKTGDVYRGNWAQGLKSGPGVYEYADGELDVSFYEKDVRAGEGVRWSASRHRASRLVDGQLVGEEGDMLVEDATKLTKQLGFVV